MSDARRRIPAIGMLLIASAALIATSPGAPTARAEIQGDVAIAPERPGEIRGRFAIPAEGATEIDHAVVGVSSGALWADETVRIFIEAEADGSRADVEGTLVTLPRSACRDGCEAEVAATLDWAGAPGPELRTRWRMELEVVYDESIGRVPIATGRVVAGGDPAVPRAAWYVIGLAVSALVGLGLLRLGTSFVRLRLVLAAGMLVAPTVVVATTPWQGLDTVMMFSMEDLIPPAAALALVLAILTGIWLTAIGSALALPSVGWVYVVLVAYTAWLVVEAAGAYRPHEVVALAAVLGVPGVAAITALPPSHPPRRVALRIGTSLVLAVLLIQFAIVLGAFVLAAAGSIDSMLAGRFGLEELGIPIGLLALAATYVAGFRRWPAGRSTLLYVVCGLTLLVAIPLMIFGVTSRSLIVASPEQIVFGAIGIGLVVVCMIGLQVLPPPPAGSSSEGPRGRREGAGPTGPPERAVG